MKRYNVREPVVLLIFDIDSTLYSNDAYAAFQNDALIQRLADERHVAFANAKAEVDRARKARADRSGGKTTSLGNAFLELGVSIQTSVRWRIEEIEPKKWLSRDASLVAALRSLAGNGYKLCSVTNNPRQVGEKALDALGVYDYFDFVIGLDDTFKSKPEPEPFLLAAKKGEEPHERCVSIGDRYDVDCATPISLGMGAILVDGVRDVYEMGGLGRI
jgi:phosphoglycolate phosphatase/putative hydrolase of the HAD superfamily